MSFEQCLSDRIDELGVVASVKKLSPHTENWHSVVITRHDKQVALPCQFSLPEAPTETDLILQALTACQHYDACDDFLDWVALYALEASDTTALTIFRDFDAAQWQFRDLLGEDVYQALMTELAMAQAIGAAAAGFSRSSQDC